MKSSSSITPAIPRSFIFLGTPGSGKTTLALRFPKAYILDCDDNLGGPVRFLRSENKLPEFKFDNMHHDDNNKPVEREKQFLHAVECLRLACSDPEIETVIVDSLSSFVEAALIHTLVLNKRPIAKDFTRADPKFEFAEWAVFGSLMLKTIFWLKSSGKTIIFTGHVITNEDELTKILQKTIGIPGAIKNKISGWFEEVWLLNAEVKRTASGHAVTYSIQSVADNRGELLGLKSATQLPPIFRGTHEELLAHIQAS